MPIQTHSPLATTQETTTQPQEQQSRTEGTQSQDHLRQLILESLTRTEDARAATTAPFVPQEGVNYFDPNRKDPEPLQLKDPHIFNRNAMACHQGHQGHQGHQDSFLGRYDNSLTSLFGDRVEENRVLPHLVVPDLIGEFAETAAMKDGAQRNLDVTEGYYKASQVLDKALFPNPAEQNQTANWPTFAVWASNEAGRAIREEGNWVMDAGSTYAPDFMMNRTSNALAEGNREVFAEIAPVAAMFAENFGGDTQRDPDKFKAFEKWMSKEAPGKDRSFGNHMLVDAFSNYYDAMVEKDPDRKQELILAANAKIGMHEQRRLQEHIETAMPWGSRKFLTENAMFLHTPKEEGSVPGFDFGRNYEALELDSPVRKHANGRYTESYPDALRRIDDPEARRTVERLGPGDHSNNTVGAENWADYDDRMTQIAELFRSRQSDPRLHNRPFTEDQKNGMRMRIKATQ